MVPDGWKKVRIDDLGDKFRPVIKAGPFGSAITKDCYVPFGYKVYGQEQVISGDPSYGNYYINEEKYQSLSSCAVSSGDILISLVGTAGRVLVIPENYEPGIINPRLLRLSLDPGKANCSFIKYYFVSTKTQRKLLRSAQGGTMGVLNADIVKKLPILLPTLPEQKKIARILSTWDKAIETLDKLIENNKQQKKALMQQLLAGKKRLPGFSGEWKKVRLGDVFTERSERGSIDLPLLSITRENGVIYRADVGRKDSSSEDKSNYKRLCPGDIGYNTMRMWQGVSGMSPYDGLVSPAYTIVNPSKSINAKFMSYLFKTPRVIHDFYRFSQGLTSDTWNLKYNHFKNVQVNIPDFKEQCFISCVLDKIDNQKVKLLDVRTFLFQMKKGLMQQLLTGKRRVRVDDERSLAQAGQI